jgi:hypothetical protein
MPFLFRAFVFVSLAVRHINRFVSKLQFITMNVCECAVFKRVKHIGCSRTMLRNMNFSY